jgi:streptogramin lyase
VPGPDGNLWFTEGPSFPAIGRITPSGTITEFRVGLGAGSEPTAIEAGPDGNLWFTDGGRSPAIGRITPSGTITEFSAGLNPRSEPESIVAGPDGNVWFTDDGGRNLGTPAIGRITPTGTITEFSAGLDPGGRPAGIVAGPDGNLWFTDTPRFGPRRGAIGRITPSGTITEFSAGLTGSPGGIVAGPDGSLWFTEPFITPAIGRITPSGTITEFRAGLIGIPSAIVAGPDGNLWFADVTRFEDRPRRAAIGRITPSGTITEFSACLHTGRLGNAFSIAPGLDGNLWFTNSTRTIGAGVGAGLGPQSAIGRITPSGKITEFSAGLKDISLPGRSWRARTATFGSPTSARSGGSPRARHPQIPSSQERRRGTRRTELRSSRRSFQAQVGSPYAETASSRGGRSPVPAAR